MLIVFISNLVTYLFRHVAAARRNLSIILDKINDWESFSRFSLRDYNVSSITINETQFSMMYSSVCVLFDVLVIK